MVLGFATLSISGALLAWGVNEHTFVGVLPGLVVYGIGLSPVLTTNDPVSLDTIPEADQGQASGVSPTAEQFGGALGIAALYSVFHAVYVDQLHAGINASPLPDPGNASYQARRSSIQAAEATGLQVSQFSPSLRAYLPIAEGASVQASWSLSSPWRCWGDRRRRRGLARPQPPPAPEPAPVHTGVAPEAVGAEPRSSRPKHRSVSWVVGRSGRSRLGRDDGWPSESGGCAVGRVKSVLVAGVVAVAVSAVAAGLRWRRRAATATTLMLASRAGTRTGSRPRPAIRSRTRATAPATEPRAARRPRCNS